MHPTKNVRRDTMDGVQPHQRNDLQFRTGTETIRFVTFFRRRFYWLLKNAAQARAVSNQPSEWLKPVSGPVVALRPEGVGDLVFEAEPDGDARTIDRGFPTMTVTATPSDADFRTIFNKLNDFNAPVVGHAQFVLLAVLLHDEAGEVIGGLWGWTVYSWLIINMLFVPEASRHRGIGTALIAAAETEARARGCAGMQVDTFGFQAQPFYERLGFTVFGVQPNFPPGQRCIFLRKQFDDA
jgi:GNAT superfamily N-acetyltransferase